MLIRNTRNEPALSLSIDKSNRVVSMATHSGPMNAEIPLDQLSSTQAIGMAMQIINAFPNEFKNMHNEYGWM